MSKIYILLLIISLFCRLSNTQEYTIKSETILEHEPEIIILKLLVRSHFYPTPDHAERQNQHIANNLKNFIKQEIFKYTAGKVWIEWGSPKQNSRGRLFSSISKIYVKININTKLSKIFFCLCSLLENLDQKNLEPRKKALTYIEFLQPDFSISQNTFAKMRYEGIELAQKASLKKLKRLLKNNKNIYKIKQIHTACTDSDFDHKGGPNILLGDSIRPLGDFHIKQILIKTTLVSAYKVYLFCRRYSVY